MASTYSPNLRIELIGDGEQYDSWGDTTNTNLGTLIEDAIAGLAVVSVTSANQALTAVDGGADQSRNAILSLTTTTSADFNVYAPPVSKLYVIHNASSYTATVYNSTSEGNTTAAGAGVAVPAGRKLFVMTDGEDFSLVTAPASSSNVANTVVERDGSGNFAAGTITATLSGNATTASTADALNTGNDYRVNSLGVGTAASGTAGEIRATNNITAYYSDDRLKTKLGNIENALDKVRALSGFYYEANEVAQAFGYEVKREVGVSAQQVQAVQPEVVAPAPIDENYLTVRYERLVPLLIEAIKELDCELQFIKQQLKGD